MIINSTDIGTKKCIYFRDKQANSSLILFILISTLFLCVMWTEEFYYRTQFFFLRCAKGHIPGSKSVIIDWASSVWPDRSLPSLKKPLQHILNVSLIEKNTFIGSFWLTHLKWHQFPALKPTVIRSLLLFMLEIRARVSKQYINFADWLHLDSVAKGNRTIAFNLS